MSGTGRKPGGGRPSRHAAIALVVALVALVLPAPPAFAHSRLLSSTPADGAHLATSPETVRLSFSDGLLEVGAAVTVLDGDSRPAQTGEIRIDGAELTLPLPVELRDGGYAVRWRVVSADGHPVSGSLTFTVGDPTASPPALAGGQTTAEPSASPAATGAPAPAQSPPPLRVLALGGLGAVAGVAVYLAVLLPLRARRPIRRGNH
ncbi:hypothetical protein SAMN02745673_01421 [Marinactinospora thermotolerans DSM 45154]|uniref:CopC domain-containing protein n=1 Tax=Marinactinospora thermotolerans DSM 45154 TaxID=1122192 RepID=A0A1T4NF50_9ACTN|nr:copper resistance CopC family protein [Marinactinospora thermotolerans]SJZ77971.1 hypothetical protein SAMN02745673_01421 [Marinactinospora thermotolerans DSM 45154]